MSTKWIGAVLVILSCSIFGMIMSGSIRFEVNCFRELISILNYMQSELEFRLTPLPDLCRLCASQGKILRNLFETFAEELENQISPEPEICMEAALCKCNIKTKSIETYLLELSSSFGKFDLCGQLLGICSVRQQCTSMLCKLESGEESRIRNYRTISFCIGILTTILLL